MLATRSRPLHDAFRLFWRLRRYACGVDADHVTIWQMVGKLRRRHGLVPRGGPREPGCGVVDWLWDAKRVRKSVQAAESAPVTEQDADLASLSSGRRALLQAGRPSQRSASSGRLQIVPGGAAAGCDSTAASAATANGNAAMT